MFAETNLKEISFKDLYVTEMKDLTVSLDTTGGVVKLEVHKREALKTLPFRKKNQGFHFSQQNEKWLLVKIIAND